MSEAELVAKAESISRKMLDTVYQQLQGVCDASSPAAAFSAIMRAFEKATNIRSEWTTEDSIALHEHKNYTAPADEGDVIASAIWAHIILADIEEVQPACQGSTVLIAFARAVTALSAASTIEAMFDDDDSIFGDNLAANTLDAFGVEGDPTPPAPSE